MEITPEGAIAIRAPKPLELPSPKEIGGKIKDKVKEANNAFFSGRRKVKEKSQMLSSIITAIGDGDVVSSWSEEQQRKFHDLEGAILGLSAEKPRTIQRVFEEILPKRLDKKKQVARNLANLLKNPPQEKADWQEAQENLARDLTVMFQRGRGVRGRAPAGPSPDWNFIIGRTSAPLQEPPEERTRREREELTGQGLEIRERRRALGRVVSIVGPILLIGTILERNANIPILPTTQLLQQQERLGFEKPERRLWARPFTERALSGTSDYTINEWYGAIYNTEASRKNVLNPHKYDDDAKMYIEEADQKLKDVPSDQIAQTLGMRGIYQNPSFHDGLGFFEGIVTAWREHRTIDPQDAKHFRDNYFEPEVGFAWPERIPQEE